LMERKKKEMGRKARVIQTKEAKDKNKDEPGLRPEWKVFIDNYIKNGGNALQAYKVAYPNCKENSAISNSHRMMENDVIRKEINYRFIRQRITDEAVFGELWEVATKYRGAKTLMAAVKALEVIARMKGMLVDTKRIEFGKDNPAYVPPVVRPESTKLLRKVEEIQVLEGEGVVVE